MFGDTIKQARMALGYSAEQVAAHLGVSPATIYRYENGDIAKLPSKHIVPLAQFLCISPASLMDWDDDQPEVPAPKVDPQIHAVSTMMEGMSKEQKDQILAIVRTFVDHQPR